MDNGRSRSEQILSEIEQLRIRGKIVDVEEEKVKVIIFSLLGDYYAFYGSHIKEILPQTNIYYVPGSPDFITGVINVRGDIESVININKLIGLPDSKNTPKSRIAIAVSGNMRSGIMLDALEDVIDVAVSSIKPAISTLSSSVGDFVVGEMMYRDRNVTLLNLGNIFARITA